MKALESIAARTQSQMVGRIGHTALLYRRRSAEDADCFAVVRFEVSSRPAIEGFFGFLVQRQDARRPQSPGGRRVSAPLQTCAPSRLERFADWREGFLIEAARKKNSKPFQSLGASRGAVTCAFSGVALGSS